MFQSTLAKAFTCLLFFLANILFGRMTYESRLERAKLLGLHEEQVTRRPFVISRNVPDDKAPKRTAATLLDGNCFVVAVIGALKDPHFGAEPGKPTVPLACVVDKEEVRNFRARFREFLEANFDEIAEAGRNKVERLSADETELLEARVDSFADYVAAPGNFTEDDS